MIEILQGDCRDVLRTLADASVNCCVTSPPYFGLRDYGVSGQIGLEATPDAFVGEMVTVFREVRRVLRDDGTLWLNLGDSYAGSGEGGGGNRKGNEHGQHDATKGKRPKLTGILKPKDLIGIPWRVAFALQADKQWTCRSCGDARWNPHTSLCKCGGVREVTIPGWYLRQDIIWHKPNPMPESVTDRCTKAHEYIFLLSKSAKYYFNSESIQETSKSPGPRIADENEPTRHGTAGARASGVSRLGAGDTRNRRSVWTVTTQPYAEAHFATFPPDLIRPCILAGCPMGGMVLDPFGGSGTTGEVAQAEGRNATLIELNPEYVKLAEKRTAQGGLFCQVPMIGTFE
jgi:DNA modification methylase